MVRLTIDGRETQAAEGATVLDAAREINIYIPTLCNSEAVAAYGACRLCMVEITTASGRGRLVASCLYPVEDGLKVATTSARLTGMRQVLIELLLARCPDSEVIRDMARKLGVSQVRFPAREPSVNRKCILCALCARVCNEVVGVSAISLAHRGVCRQLTTPFNEDYSEACIGCGSCAYICPTGAITMTDVLGKRTVKWPHTQMVHKMKRCSVCGTYWAPEKQIEHMARVSDTLPEEYNVCTNCRQ